jgi:hypothetical protein
MELHSTAWLVPHQALSSVTTPQRVYVLTRRPLQIAESKSASRQHSRCLGLDLACQILGPTHWQMALLFKILSPRLFMPLGLLALWVAVNSLQWRRYILPVFPVSYKFMIIVLFASNISNGFLDVGPFRQSRGGSGIQYLNATSLPEDDGSTPNASQSLLSAPPRYLLPGTIGQHLQLGTASAQGTPLQGSTNGFSSSGLTSRYLQVFGVQKTVTQAQLDAVFHVSCTIPRLSYTSYY